MFQSAGLGPVNSAPIALAAGPAARIVVRTAPPSSVNNGVAMVPQPVVEIQDAGGNRVSANVLVTLTTNAITGTITNGSATTINGVATFSGLTLSGPLGERDYWFTAAGLFSFTMRIGIR